MKTLLIVITMLIAAPAFALSNDVAEFCITSSKDVRECIKNGLDAEREAERQHELRMLELQRDIMQKQALGLALFGTGPAIISGMNQGFQNMQVKPYMIPVR